MRSALPLLVCLFAAPACAQSLCTTSETPIFTCAAKAKIVSACASKDLGPKNGYLRFRVGANRRTAVTYPRNAAHGSNNITYGYADIGQGPPGHYIMLNERHDIYGLITTDERGPQYGGEETAFVRQRGDKPVEALSCDQLTNLDSGIDLLGRAGFRDVDSGTLILP